MAKIRHIALTTKDPVKVADFYKEVFGMEEVRRSPGGVFLSDGYLNMAILHFKTEKDADVGPNGPNFSGIHHIGFLAEGLDKYADKLEKAGGKRLSDTVKPHTGGLFGHPTEFSFAEVKFSGPDGVILDMSESGWQVTP